MDLCLCRSLSAQQFCVAMWHASKAGVKEAALYGFRPGAPTGHYQRHLKVVIPGLDQQDYLCTVDIATQDKDGNKCKRKLSVLQPHEVLERVARSP